MALQAHCPHICLAHTPDYVVLHGLPRVTHMPYVHRHEVHLHILRCMFTHLLEAGEKSLLFFSACNMPPPSIPGLFIEHLFSVFIYITESVRHLSVRSKSVFWWTQMKGQSSLKKICVWMFLCLCSCFTTRSSNHHRVMGIEMRLICLDVQADEGVTMVSGTL